MKKDENNVNFFVVAAIIFIILIALFYIIIDSTYKEGKEIGAALQKVSCLNDKNYYLSCKEAMTCIINEEKCLKEGKTQEWFRSVVEDCNKLIQQ